MMSPLANAFFTLSTSLGSKKEATFPVKIDVAFFVLQRSLGIYMAKVVVVAASDN